MGVEEKLVTLGLVHAAEEYGEVTRKATTQKLCYGEFLGALLESELTHRRRRKEAMLMKLANLPVVKTFEGFDFSFNPSVEKRIIDELKSTRFVEERQNLLLLGPPGVGKTHIAIALGVEVIKNGFTTYFTTVDEITRRLKSTKEEGFTRRMKAYTRTSLLIIDEMGYLPLNRDEANLLFSVVNSRYERGSIIITSNKSVTKWGEYLSDHVLATAILDRLLHHSYVIVIKGKSYRLKNRIIQTEEDKNDFSKNAV